MTSPDERREVAETRRIGYGIRRHKTCHIAPDDLASEQCMGPMLSCDRCGAAFPSINEDYNYCPNCGARVTDGGESR